MRLLIFEFHQETNTFNPVIAGPKDFHPQCVFEGEARFAGCRKAGAANLKQLRWHNLPAGMYPFDLPADYSPAPAKLV